MQYFVLHIRFAFRLRHSLRSFVEEKPDSKCLLFFWGKDQALTARSYWTFHTVAEFECRIGVLVHLLDADTEEDVVYVLASRKIMASTID